MSGLHPQQTSQSASDVPGETAPIIRVTKGEAEAEEIAALVSVLVVASGSAGPSEKNAEGVVTHWARPQHARYQYPRSWAESRLPR